MDRGTNDKPIRGFILACTDSTEKECFERMLFGAATSYGPVVIRIRKGDLLFLNNLDSKRLHGVFRATSDGSFNISPEAWGGDYQYQVRVELLDRMVFLKDSLKLLKKLKIKRNTPLFGKRLAEFLQLFSPGGAVASLDSYSSEEGSDAAGPAGLPQVDEEAKKIKKIGGERDIEEEVPLIEATTFWDFPRQSYGLTPKGDNQYPGVTPALIIYNLIWRYTKPGDLVVDPMCGSGTTIDVCKQEKRRVSGYDISPVRDDIVQGDARKIPLDDGSVDMVFIDSPYGDNVRYNEHPDDIGKISSETDKFYDELEKVMKESQRILKPGKVLGWLIGDQWLKKTGFTPVGFKVFERLCKHFEPVDIICVARRGQSSHTGPWFNRARKFNFYLRGFKHLFIMRKADEKEAPKKKQQKANWTQYPRGKGKSKKSQGNPQ